MVDWLHLVADNDGHWYIIPVNLDDEFEAWLDAMEDYEDWQGTDFESYRLGVHPSNVHFIQYCINETAQT